MQRTLIVLLSAFAAIVIGCKQSNDTVPPGPPATPPAVGAQFVYHVDASWPDGSDPRTLSERDTIHSASATSFTVSRVSDTIGGYSTSALKTYLVLPSGDLSATYECGCDTLPLPIASHQSYDPHPGGFVTPTKLNGFVDPNSRVFQHSQYDGQESITTAGTTFDCMKVSETTTLIVMSPYFRPGVSQYDTAKLIHRYWYSHAIHFFVKDQIQLVGIDSLIAHPPADSSNMVFTRTLVSYH